MSAGMVCRLAHPEMPGLVESAAASAVEESSNLRRMASLEPAYCER